MPLIPDINILFVAIAVTLLAAPYLVALVALQTSKTMPERKLDARRIAHAWLAWLMTVIAGLSLVIVGWHEFSLISAALYMLVGTVVAVISICVLIISASGPA